MLRIDSSAGLAAASISLRWMPLLKKSAPPASSRTRIGRDLACTTASRSRSHWRVDTAPL